MPVIFLQAPGSEIPISFREVSWWIFLIAGVVAILIALLTVSFQAIKAAMANPVKSLRTE